MQLIGFDLETTGLDPEVDRVLTAFIGKPFAFNPGVENSSEAQAVNGLSNEAIAKFPPAEKEWKKVSKYLRSLGSVVLVGHYVKFDATFMAKELQRHGLPMPQVKFLCTREIDIVINPDRTTRRTLSALYREYVGKDLQGAHEAKTDALAAIALFKEMMPKLKGAQLPVRTIEELAQ